MGLFNFGKKKPVKRVGGYIDGGNHKVDVFDGPDGVVEIKRCSAKGSSSYRTSVLSGLPHALRPQTGGILRVPDL